MPAVPPSQIQSLVCPRKAPETYDLRKVSASVEASMVAKFDRLPPGVADALKKNNTFVGDGGPMRDAVFTASPPTKEELLQDSPGAVEIAVKVSCRIHDGQEGWKGGSGTGVRWREKQTVFVVRNCGEEAQLS